MTKNAYLMDTHALIFWNNKESVSDAFVHFFDEQVQQGRLYVSSISFWEIALLVKKGRLAISDIHAWKKELFIHTNIQLIDPTAEEMVDSTLLPNYHTDHFDRLLISQANQNKLSIVTKDATIKKSKVKTFWI